jgi:putative ABC transport system permease protein
MKVLFKLALNNLKKNRTQTFITLIGIVLSVILITSVFTFFSSVYVTFRNEIISTNGSWNYTYDEIDASQKKVLDSKPYIKATYPLVYFSNIKTNGVKVRDTRIFLMGTDLNGFKYLPFHITSGGVPHSSSEILVSDTLFKLYPDIFSVGKTLSLDLGKIDYPSNEFVIDETKTLTITGSYEGSNSSLYEFGIYSYVDASSLNPNDKIAIGVVEKNISSDSVQRAKDFASSIPNYTNPITFNEAYLALSGVDAGGYGGAIATILLLVIFLILIIIIGSTAMIYSGFSMTATDLLRQLGLLGSVGATRSQKRLILLIQAAVLSVIGITIGLILGTGVVVLLIYFINIQSPEIIVKGGIILNINGFILLAAILVSILTVFISALLPARNVSKQSAIDLIRQNRQIKLEKSMRNTPIFLKPFGIEVTLGYKNIKRFNKRHRATRFSIVLSLVLFLVVMGYSTLTRQSALIYTSPDNYDVSVSLNTIQESQSSSFYQQISQFQEIKNYSLMKQFRCITNLNLFIEKPNNSDPKSENIEVVVLDDAALSKYLLSLDLPQDILDKDSSYKALLINKGTVFDPFDQTYYEKTYLNVRGNDIIDIAYKTGETDQNGTELEPITNKVKIVAIVDQYPLGLNNASNGPILIINQKSSQLIFSKTSTNTIMFIQTDNPGLVESKVNKIYEAKPIGRLFIHNISGFIDQQNRNLQTLFIFLYTFVGIVSTISLMNILNSIYTTITNRRRELAMLKSVGMTQKSLRRMLGFESLFYGFESILIGFPLGLALVYGIYIMMNANRYIRFNFDFPYLVLIPTGLAVVLIVYLTMLLTLRRLEKDNIIDQLKDETV